MVVRPETLARTMLNGNETVLPTVSYLQICGASLIILNLRFIYEFSVQGMGFPFVPMISGVVETVSQIFAILFLLPVIGFYAAAAAEVVSWITSSAMNGAAYFVHIKKASSSLTKETVGDIK